MFRQLGLGYLQPEDLFCDGLQLVHFFHQVVDIRCSNFKIRFIPETCVSTFKEMESCSFLGCCSDKDMVHILQVKTEERQHFVEIVAVEPETGDGL